MDLNGLFSAQTGYLVIGAYLVLMVALTMFVRHLVKRENKVSYLLMNRRLPSSWSGISTAGCWIAAPALFVSAQLFYTGGWQRFFIWAIPNIAVLAIFGFFAKRMVDKWPEGFTLSEVMRGRYSGRVQKVYWFQLVATAILIGAIQLLAAGLVVSTLTGTSFFWTTLLVACVPAVYVMISGLRASIVTDVVQVFMILAGIILIIGAVLVEAGPATVADGWNGAEGMGTPDTWFMVWTFGIPTILALLTGPFAEQSFYQRAFATKKNRVLPAFLLATFIFAFAPLAFGMLGAIGAGAGIPVADPQLTNVSVVLHYLPTWVLAPFLWVVFSALLSTFDALIVGVGAITGHDVQQEGHLRPDSWSWLARLGIAGATLAAVAVANIPGLTLVYLALFYGTLRSSTVIPTMITLWTKGEAKLSERAVFWAVLAAIVIGLPISAYGNLSDPVRPGYVLAGILVTLGISGLGSVLLSKFLPESSRDRARGTAEAAAAYR